MIVNLEGIKDAETRDWSRVFAEGSPYRLLYSLKIIEFLMSDSEPDDEETTNTEKSVTQWRQDFIAYGGFE